MILKILKYQLQINLNYNAYIKWLRVWLSKAFCALSQMPTIATKEINNHGRKSKKRLIIPKLIFVISTVFPAVEIDRL